MELGTAFFKSKIGKRFFFLFLFCAFLPTVLLMILSYQRVSWQLEEQSLFRLQKDTKSYGLSLFERLVRMENLLGLYGIKRSLTGNQRIDIENELEKQMSTLFKGVCLFTESGEYTLLTGALDVSQIKHIASQYSNDKKQKSHIVTRSSSGPISPVFMLVALDKKQPEKGFLVAELKPSFLWGIGTNTLLPTMTELAIFDDSGQQIIITNAAVDENQLMQGPRRLQEAGMRQFEYERDGTVYVASSWPLFLQSSFDAPIWTIIFSQSKKNILAPMAEFEKMFPLVIALSMWIILFLSMYFLRKTLAPLNLLQVGTQRIATKDFTTQVSVNSGDEFEELADSFNAMTAQLNKQFNALAVIDKIDRAIFSSLDTAVIVSTALRMMRDFFNAEVILFARANSENPETLELAILEKGYQVSPDCKYTDITDVERENIFGHNEFTLLESSEQIPRFLSPFAEKDTIFLSLPLLTKRKLTGAVILSQRVTDQLSIEEEIKQARQIADQLAIALENALLIHELERLSIGTIEALARTVDAKSEWTAGHSERVAELSVRIGRYLGFNEERISLLNRGGLLHDIGKIGVPIAILDKPGKLDNDEFETVRSHPLIGEKILQPINVYKDILPIVVQHHERFDGKGYPHGLSGDDIDLNARVLAVADVYDALISQRPYRQGWVQENVLNFMKEQTGKMFDPKVVDALMTIIPEHSMS